MSDKLIQCALTRDEWQIVTLALELYRADHRLQDRAVSLDVCQLNHTICRQTGGTTVSPALRPVVAVPALVKRA